VPKDFSELHARADAAGAAAADAHSPTPMHVVQRENPFDENSPIIKRYAPVADGVCGFGWINIRPGNHPFANWAKKRGLARKSYSGGVDIWVSRYGQSYERKLAYARAYAEVLTEAGIKAYGTGRLD
jgi:hypothetical protein